MTEETAARVGGFLGLCTRAGQLAFGQESCVDAVRKHKAAVVLLDMDCSENTRKRFLDTCKTHRTLLYGLPSGMIARVVGKEGRMVVAVKPGGMADKVLDLLKGEPVMEQSSV